MSKITYADKEYIYKNDEIPAINKITDDDMNEIKSVVNEIDTNVSAGWISSNETWTYASVDNPTGVITISGDKTSKYSLGMKIKFKNAANVIYGFITKINYSSPNTTLTFLHEINPSTSQALHLMTNSAITENYYSTVKSPYGFPLDKTKWSITHQILTTANLNNSGYSTIDTARVPVGLWSLTCKMMLGQTISSQVNATIGWSTSSTSWSNNKYKLFGSVKLSGNIFEMLVSPCNIIETTSKTTWYWICQVSFGTPSAIQNTATIVPSEYAFECAYL